MEAKFKIGDTIICPTAEQPAPVKILAITREVYVMDYEPYTTVSIANQDKWQLHNPNTIKRSDLITLMKHCVSEQKRQGESWCDFRGYGSAKSHPTYTNEWFDKQLDRFLNGTLNTSRDYEFQNRKTDA
jgi:hypothetical protein